MSRELLLFIILILPSLWGYWKEGKSPSRNTKVDGLFPVWDLQLITVLPLPWLCGGAGAGGHAGELPCMQRSCPDAWPVCEAVELLDGTGGWGVPRPSWHLGSAWEVQELKHGRSQCWERFLNALEWASLGLFSSMSTQWDLCCLDFLKWRC